MLCPGVAGGLSCVALSCRVCSGAAGASTVAPGPAAAPRASAVAAAPWAPGGRGSHTAPAMGVPGVAPPAAAAGAPATRSGGVASRAAATAAPTAAAAAVGGALAAAAACVASGGGGALGVPAASVLCPLAKAVAPGPVDPEAAPPGGTAAEPRPAAPWPEARQQRTDGDQSGGWERGRRRRTCGEGPRSAAPCGGPVAVAGLATAPVSACCGGLGGCW